MTMQDKELVQDVVDRLLYLNEQERVQFDNSIKELLENYPISFQEVNGIRIYSFKNK
jgi:hypothetical protein